MRSISSRFSSLLSGAAAMAVAVAVIAGPVLADEAVVSDKEFRTSCAICHGVSGTGDGVLAKLLTVAPADLTTLAKRNHGEYPFLRVFQTIDGRSTVAAHGERQMPIWGDRYTEETGVEPGTYGSELLVRARILDLVYYLQTIQKK